jgi:pimeloyl-ACP methyl ester carboxylesterase
MLLPLSRSTPTVLLLPGLACDAELFADQQPVLAAQHRVHISDVHTRALTLPAMATLLWAEQPGAHVLVGASMGGMLALEMWRQAPERVRGIALLGSTARPDTPELITLRTQACGLFACGRMDELLAANVLFAFHPKRAADKPLVQRYLAMMRRAGAAQLIAQNQAVMARADSRPLLPDIRCPLLLACGEADGLTPPELAREMAALAPAAHVHIVPGAGHMLTMEQPELVNALLLDWLASLSV